MVGLLVVGCQLGMHTMLWSPAMRLPLVVGCQLGMHMVSAMRLPHHSIESLKGLLVVMFRFDLRLELWCVRVCIHLEPDFGGKRPGGRARARARGAVGGGRRRGRVGGRVGRRGGRGK